MTYIVSVDAVLDEEYFAELATNLQCVTVHDMVDIFLDGTCDVDWEDYSFDGESVVAIQYAVSA